MSALTTAAFAAPVAFNVILNGPNEPTNSLGTGTGTITYDTTAHTMRVQANFTGLTGDTTAAHIHSPTALPLTGTASVATSTSTAAFYPAAKSAASSPPSPPPSPSSPPPASSP